MVGFAVVGLGMGRGRARLVSETGGAELVAVVDLNAELAREVGEELGCHWSADLGEVLGRHDVDAVLVMTPSGLHAKIGIQAVEAGKHVVTTKPMDVTVAACDRLIAAADTAGVKLAVSYQRRMSPDNIIIKKLLDTNALGKIFAADMRVKFFRDMDYYNSGPYRGNFEIDGGGPFMQQAAHNVDIFVSRLRPLHRGQAGQLNCNIPSSRAVTNRPLP